MVSHIVLLADAGGDVAIAERAPGTPLFARRGRGKVPLTNHFEGPLADDPANRRVEAVTSTRARRLRLDELLAALPEGASVEQIVGVLRDRRGLSGGTLALGDRRALDALIATHSVVMDATARVMWVSEGPHLAGRYLRFDVGALLAEGFEPRPDDPVEAIPAGSPPDQRRLRRLGAGRLTAPWENPDAPATTRLPVGPLRASRRSPALGVRPRAGAVADEVSDALADITRVRAGVQTLVGAVRPGARPSVSSRPRR